MQGYGSSHRVAAVVTLAEGIAIGGDLHVQPAAARHLGAETPLEMLNRREPFFPLTQDDGEAIFIAKKQVAFVENRDSVHLADPVRASVARMFPLEVTLLGGLTLTGVSQSELPPEHSRTSDFLNNSAEAFFPLQTDQALLYINRDHVRVARSLR
ncbi:MAG TPA: hypothetical protein VJN95_02390 [Gemmatimonadales bacterium]|nr:hypothetical protein [Gemmatimonadales bacterium]